MEHATTTISRNIQPQHLVNTHWQNSKYTTTATHNQQRQPQHLAKHNANIRNISSLFE